MRKVLALVLAMVMVLSLATIASASTPHVGIGFDIEMTTATLAADAIQRENIPNSRNDWVILRGVWDTLPGAFAGATNVTFENEVVLTEPFLIGQGRSPNGNTVADRYRYLNLNPANHASEGANSWGQANGTGITRNANQGFHNSVRNQESMIVYLMYVDATVPATPKYVPINRALVNRWNISISLAGSSNVWAGVAIEYSGDVAMVRFDTHRTLHRTGDIRSNDTVRVSVNNRVRRDGDFKVDSRLRVQALGNTVNADDEYIFLDSYQRRFEVMEFIPSTEIELVDSDAVIHTRLFAGWKYVFMNNQPNATAESVMNAFPQVEEVRMLHTTGIPDSARVQFDFDDNLWIYTLAPGAGSGGPAITLLGRSRDMLPLVEYYFIADREIAVAPIAPVEPPAEAAPPATTPETGGGASAPNANWNPGTGR